MFFENYRLVDLLLSAEEEGPPLEASPLLEGAKKRVQGAGFRTLKMGDSR